MTEKRYFTKCNFDNRVWVLNIENQTWLYKEKGKNWYKGEGKINFDFYVKCREIVEITEAEAALIVG